MPCRVLYLHGFSGRPDGVKYRALRAAPGFEVHLPLQLPFPDKLPTTWGQKARMLLSIRSRLREAVAVAREAIRAFRPQVLVGSSMGGALAIEVATTESLVLLAPATRIRWLPVGAGPYPDRPVPAGTIILHSREDALVPLEASRALLRRSQSSTNEGRDNIAGIGEALARGGYSPEDNRLLVLGADHQCNDPHGDHLGRPEMHPHAAMVFAARCLGNLLDV